MFLRTPEQLLPETRAFIDGARAAAFKVAEDNQDLRQEVSSLKETIERSNLPHIATAEIRGRIADQAKKADRLHDEAVTRTLLFQHVGLGTIVFGLLIIAAGAVLVFTKQITATSLVPVVPIVGVVFNLVGGGLIAFHKTASNTALQYYDRKQELDNLLTALELSTSKVMRETVVGLMDSLIGTLFPSGSRVKPVEAIEAEKKA
ncbi:MAG: hypothetical protein EON58_22240 [Alphaproteobacteria bacterium]|nr:MAG: hypothetical protein EON58_22240 [Alphaproteobacteria bacterium]